LAVCSQDLVRSGAPDCPVVHRIVSGAPGFLGANWLLLGNSPATSAKIHRTVRCAPDCPVSQRSAGPTVGRAICAGHVAEPTVGRRHLTVRCAPDCPVCTGHVRCANGSQISNGLQRSAAPVKETNRAPDSVRCAPDCPVPPSTEGTDGLLKLLSTAPSCLGAIKGAPRRMEEIHKQPLSILDHPHSVFAQLFVILSDSSSVLVRTLL
jgi:hypothetical protein